MELNRLPDDVAHVIGFGGEDAVVMQLDAVMFQPDIPMVLLQPGADRTACLSSVEMTTLTGDTALTRCLQSQAVHE
jgi:hypothetical protein